MLSPTTESVRLFLHVVAASVWVGGQIVLAGLVPQLRRSHPEAVTAIANGFGKIAWPAYVVATKFSVLKSSCRICLIRPPGGMKPMQ